MKRWMLMLLLFACALGWAGLMSIDFTGQGGGNVAPGGTNVAITYFDYNQSAFSNVTVYLSVVDDSGQPILGLDRSEFSVEEDGIPVDVTSFVEAGKQPVTAVMLIDRSGSMDSGDKMQDAISAAQSFLDHLEDGRDRAGVLAFDDEIVNLGSLRLIDSSVRADLAEEIGNLTTGGSTAYYDTIYQAIDMLQGTEGRKVVLALTDGMDTSSSRGRRTVVRHAQDNLVVIYTIGLGTDVSQWSLEAIAEDTGGQYYEQPSGSDLAALYVRMAEGLQNEYSLVYPSPTPLLDGTTRQVEVTIDLPAGQATARGNYAVGGTLTPSLNAWPCLGAIPLLLLLVAPAVYDRVRGRGEVKEEGESELPPVPPPAVQPPGAVCPHCGASLRPGARFCNGCGRSISGVAAAPPAQACPHCGGPLRPGARFCGTCGHSTGAPPSSPVCRRCGSRLKPGTRFCANCGQGVY